VQIISLFNQLRFIFYKHLLSNTRNGLKSCRRNTPYLGHEDWI